MNHSNEANEPRRERQRGNTLVEVTISTVLVAGLLAMLYGGVVSVGSVTQENNRVMREQSRERDLLDSLRAELELSGATGSRFTIANAGKTIRYEKLVGAARTGAEVSGVWSPQIEIGLDGRGNVVRRENGRAYLIAMDVEDLAFAHRPGDPFLEVTVTTAQEGRNVTRTMRVFPRN